MSCISSLVQIAWIGMQVEAFVKLFKTETFDSWFNFEGAEFPNAGNKGTCDPCRP